MTYSNGDPSIEYIILSMSRKDLVTAKVDLEIDVRAMLSKNWVLLDGPSCGIDSNGYFYLIQAMTRKIEKTNQEKFQSLIDRQRLD